MCELVREYIVFLLQLPNMIAHCGQSQLMLCEHRQGGEEDGTEGGAAASTEELNWWNRPAIARFFGWTVAENVAYVGN